MLCDTSGSLINAIGLKKAPSGITRGVFVIDKSGKILATEPGGPEATMKVVQKLVDSTEAVVAPVPVDEVAVPEAVAAPVSVEEVAVPEVAAAPASVEEPKIEETTIEANETNGATKEEDVAQAEVAGEVADTAEKLDETKVDAV